MASKGKKINKDEEKEPLQVLAHPASARARAAKINKDEVKEPLQRAGGCRSSARVGCRAPFFSCCETVPSCSLRPWHRGAQRSLRTSLPPSAAHFPGARVCTQARTHARTHVRTHAREETLNPKP